MIHVDPTTIFRSLPNFKPEALRKLDDSVMDEITMRMSKRLADYAQKRFSDVLRKGHKFEVGASEQAAENIIVEKTSTGWVVKEGSAVSNNLFIRSGLNPRSVAAPGSRSRDGQVSFIGANAMVAGLRKWAIEKGLPIYDLGEYATPDGWLPAPRNTLFKSVQYTKSKPSRPYKRDQSKFDKAITRIYWALIWHGTHRGPGGTNFGRKGANWWGLHPSGQGRFEYADYVMRSSTGTLENQLQTVSNEIAGAIVEYIRDGEISGFRTLRKK